MLGITLLSFVSFLFNRLLVSEHLLIIESKIFYVIRPLEYFLFFYIGGLYALYFDIGPLMKAFFLWNLAWMVLQKLNLAGGILASGYTADVSGRAQGIASFPSEMGLILNLLFCWMIYNERPRSPFFPYRMFLIFGILVILTGNRISILALTLCFLFYLGKQFNFRSISSIILLLILTPLLLGALFLVMRNCRGLRKKYRFVLFQKP